MQDQLTNSVSCIDDRKKTSFTRHVGIVVGFHEIMRNKFLKIILLLTISVNAHSFGDVSESLFSFPGLGKCFKDTDSFLIDTIGPDAPSDDNIIKTSKNSWIWIVDQTASKNYTWYILEATTSGVCLSAFIPSASNVKLHKEGNMETIIEASISSEADFPEKLIKFKKDNVSLTFKPTDCYLIKNKNNKAIRKSVSCKSILD